jgi:hypothetical protein
MLIAVLKAVKMLLSCCTKNSQDVVVLAALKAVQDAEKNHPHKDQVQRLIPIRVQINDVYLFVWKSLGFRVYDNSISTYLNCFKLPLRKIESIDIYSLSDFL